MMSSYTFTIHLYFIIQPYSAVDVHTSPYIRRSILSTGLYHLHQDGISAAPAVRALGAGGPAQMALKAAKLEGRVEVIDFEETSEHFAPGFMVAVDYEVRSEGFRSTSEVCAVG